MVGRMENVAENLSPFDLVNGGAEKLSPAADFDGPVRNRRITDPTCFLVLLATWGVATWIGVWSIQNGNINILLHPTDYKGRICGVDSDSNGNLLPELWHPVDALSNGVCVEECPTENKLEPVRKDDLICKEDADLMNMDGCTAGGVISNNVDDLITCGGCMYQIGSTLMNDYCNPKSVSAIIGSINNAAEGNGLDTLDEWKRFHYSSYIQIFVRDFRTSFPAIGGAALGGAVVFSALYLLLFRFPVVIPTMIRASSILAPFVMAGIGAFLFLLSREYSSDGSGLHSNVKQIVVQVLAYTLWSASAILFLAMILLRKQIGLTISIAKAASRPIQEVKFIALFPFLHLFAFSIVFGTLGFWFVMLGSSRRLVQETGSLFGYELTYVTQDYATLSHYMFWVLIFVFCWTIEFMSALGKLTLSLCYSKWYYTPEKDEGNSVSFISSLGTVLCKHAGSAAFGSLIIKPIQIVRAPFLALQHGIKSSGMDNALIDAIICSCQCGLFILERFLKFSSHTTYIQTAIFGDSHCKGSHKSYYLGVRNADIFEESGPVGFLSVFFCKMMITTTVSLISYAMMKVFYGDELFSIVSLVAVLAVIVWYIAEMFTDVMAMSVSTLLYCFVADEEIMGDEGSPFVPHELDEFLNRLTTGSDKLVMGDAETKVGSDRSYDEPSHDNDII